MLTRREQAIGQQVTHVPLRRPLRGPSPEDPARLALIRLNLRLDELADVGLLEVRQASGAAIDLARAAAGGARRAGLAAVVARADALAVEVLGAVRDGAGPLADEGGLVAGDEMSAGELADGADVCVDVHGKLALIEDMIVVGVHDDVAVGCLETVPAFGGFEAVAEDEGHVWAEPAETAEYLVVVAF